jgi:low affinity Fe/Cu permease
VTRDPDSKTGARSEPSRSTAHERFDAFSSAVARRTGHPGAFIFATLGVTIWLISGPIFHFSDTWQLVVNTATTVITFLMVFVIQNSLNRDSLALHLKLDELVRVTAQATDRVMGAERLSEEEIEGLEREELRQARDSGEITSSTP